MSTSVKYEDLFDENLFAKLNKNLEEARENVKKFAADFIQQINFIASTVDKNDLRSLLTNLNKISVVNAKVKASFDYLNKYEQAIAKLNFVSKEAAERAAKLAERESDLAKKLAIVNYELREANADLRNYSESIVSSARVKEVYRQVINNEITSYYELSEALKILRIAYKDAEATNKDFIEEVQMSREEFKKFVADLDKRVKKIDESVGQFQRNVGAYKQKVVDAFVEVGGTVVQNLTSSSDAASKFSSVFAAAMQAAVLAAENASGGINKLGAAVKNFAKTAVFLLALQLAIEGIQYAIRKLTNEAEALNDLYKKLEISIYSNVRAINEYITLLDRQRSLQKDLLDLDKNESLAVLREKIKINNALLSIQRKLIDFEIDALRRKRDLLETELKKANNDERIAEISKELLEVTQKLNELDIKRYETIVKQRELQETYADAVRKLQEDLREFARVNADAIQNSVTSYKDAVSVINKTFTELARRANGDMNLLSQVYAAYNARMKAAARDFKQAVSDMLNDIKSLANNIVANDDAFNAFVLSFEAANEQIKQLTQKLQDLDKLEQIAKRFRNVFDKSFADDINIVRSRLQLAIQQLQSNASSAADAYIETLRDSLAASRAEFLDAEDKFIYEIQKKRERLFRELLDKQVQITKLLDTAELDAEFRKELESVANEIAETIAYLQNEFETQIRDTIQKMRREQLLSSLETFYLTDVVIIKQLRENNLRYAKTRDERVKIEEEYNKKMLELQKRYIEQQIAILEKFADDESQKRILQLKAQLTDINKQIADNLQKEFEETLDKLKQELQKSTDAVLEIYSALAKRSLDAQLRALQNYTQQLQNRINLVIAAAQRGAANAGDSIAELEKRQAEAQRQEQKLKEQAQRREMFLTALKTYSASLEQTKDPLRAFFDTIRNVTLLRQFAASLPTFYQGTEYVTTRSKNALFKLDNVAKDAIVARLHEGERVIPSTLNRKLQGISNEELVDKVTNADTTRVEFDYDSLHESLVMSIKSKLEERKVKRPL